MNILIVKTSSLGDIIHAFAAVDLLKKTYPHASIDWVVEKAHASLVKAHPVVDHVIEIDTKSIRQCFFSKEGVKEFTQVYKALREKVYDAVIDFQGNTKSAFITFLAKSKNKIGFGKKTVHEWPNLLVTHHQYNPPLYRNVREENLYLVQEHFPLSRLKEGSEKVTLLLNAKEKEQWTVLQNQFNELEQPKILICAGSAWKNKQLTKETLIDFLKEIEKKSQATFIFAWGTVEEKLLVEEFKLQFTSSIILDKLSLPLLQNVMSLMDKVIAMDSLPLHLAGTANVSTWSVFGASSALKYKPMGKEHVAIQGSCPYGVSFERRCPKLRTCPTGACIRNLSSKDLSF